MKYLPVSTFVLLSACGATIGPTYVEAPTIVETVPFRAASELTPLAEVPNRGHARYSGDIGFGAGQVDRLSDARVAGDLALDVDFNRDVVSGRADGFVDRLTGERLAGDLKADFRIYRDAEDTGSDAIAGFTDGTLYRPNGDRVAVELDTYADFYGSGGERIAGSVEGNVDGLALTPDVAVTGVIDVRR